MFEKRPAKATTAHDTKKRIHSKQKKRNSLIDSERRRSGTSTVANEFNTGIFRLTCKRSEIYLMLRLIMITIKIKKNPNSKESVNDEKRIKKNDEHCQPWNMNSSCARYLHVSHSLFNAYAKIIKDSKLKEFNECNPIHSSFCLALSLPLCPGICTGGRSQYFCVSLITWVG